jgi:hypothetical protein
VGPTAGLHDAKKRKSILPGLELRPLGCPASRYTGFQEGSYSDRKSEFMNFSKGTGNSKFILFQIRNKLNFGNP